MEEAVFPPSPSWFLPNIIDTREDGSICYGSKNNVVILQTGATRKLEMILIQGAHNYRVTSVAFSPTNCDESMVNTLVSSSEDCFVKLWSISTLSATMGHNCHTDPKGNLSKVVSLDWSIANPKYIISVAENNSLVLWDVCSNTTVKYNFQKLGATVVSCCPYNDKVVAVGGKTGEIYIINLNENGNVLYRLRGHDNKIQSLSWCPIPYNIFKVDEIVEEFLLASGCQNKEIFIWRVGSDGKCENKFQVPTNALCNKDGQHPGKIKNTFSYLTLSWLEAYKLYTSSSFGELIYFDFKSFVSNKLGGNGKGKASKSSLHVIKVAHCFHSKGLYAIAGLPAKAKILLYKNMSIESELQFPIMNNNVEFLKDCVNENSNLAWDVIVPEFSSLVWTAGQDRKLVACEVKLSDVERIFNCHTLNGFVYCAVVSPHDPNKIAIGVGDGMIRLLNLTQPSGDIQVYWQKIKDRVMCLAWHPKREGLLAYGTSEGRVGLLDTMSNKLPSVFKPSHPQPIYTLSWGPEFPTKLNNTTTQNEFDLYSVGNNTLSLYQPSRLNAEPLNLSKIIPFPCKKQTDVCWKPDFSLMAVGNEDGNICLVEPVEFKIVYTLLAYKKLIQSIAWHPCSTTVDADISPLSGYFTSGSTDNECLIKVFNCTKEKEDVKVNLVATLKGHYGHIQSVSWSPHISGRLISNSADGSVQIWDVISQCPLVNFTPIGTPVFSIWNPVNPDFVFTGCRNDIFCIWETTTQTKVHPSSNTKPKKQKKEKELNLSIPKELLAKDVEVDEILKSDSSKTFAVAELKTITKNSKESKMFCKIWKKEDLKNCYYLLKNDSDESIKQNYSLSFFCDEKFFEESIKAEEEVHKKANNWNEIAELALWSGKIKEVLEEKIASGQLNDFLVSLAPSISPRLWQEACLSYSATLVEKKFYRKAASYLIICHKIYEAINLLLDANLYLEALCIARSRLPKTDPIFKEIIRRYAEWLFKNGSFVKACECYIALEEYLEVAKICGKKNQAEYLSLAALAAKRSRCFDLEAVEAANAIFKCLETKNFDLAEQICEDHRNLKHLKLIFFIFQTIHRLDIGEIELESDILSYIKDSFETDVVVFPDTLPKLFHQYAFYKQKEQIFIIVSQELSFAACKKDIDEVVTHLTRALSTCSRYIPNQIGETHLLYRMCQWLSPGGFLSESSIFTGKDNLRDSKLKSLRAFLGASIVRHLSENNNSEDNIKWFDFLVNLKEDLLDADSHRYFQNLIEIEILEKRLLRNRFKLSSKALMTAGKYSVHANSNKNPEDTSLISFDQIIGSKESEKSCIESDVEVGIQGENIKLVHIHNQIVVHDMVSADSTVICCRDENSKGNNKSLEICSSDFDSENSSEKIITDLNVLKRLKTEVEQFEADRVSSPNPVPVYFMLKKLCEGFSENKSANLLLNYLNSKWESLN